MVWVKFMLFFGNNDAVVEASKFVFNSSFQRIMDHNPQKEKLKLIIAW